MTDPNITITISRTSLSLPPLEFSALVNGVVLGVAGYQEPAYIWNITSMPPSQDTHGSEPISAAYEQALLGWDWMRDDAANETQVQAAREEVRAALAQFSYFVTTQVSDAPGEVWTASPGSLTPPARTYEDLANFNPVYSVTIPVYPIPGA